MHNKQRHIKDRKLIIVINFHNGVGDLYASALKAKENLSLRILFTDSILRAQSTVVERHMTHRNELMPI